MQTGCRHNFLAYVHVLRKSSGCRGRVGRPPRHRWPHMSSSCICSELRSWYALGPEWQRRLLANALRRRIGRSLGKRGPQVGGIPDLGRPGRIRQQYQLGILPTHHGRHTNYPGPHQAVEIPPQTPWAFLIAGMRIKAEST
jgi:hypothetical protein